MICLEKLSGKCLVNAIAFTRHFEVLTKEPGYIIVGD